MKKSYKFNLNLLSNKILLLLIYSIIINLSLLIFNLNNIFLVIFSIISSLFLILLYLNISKKINSKLEIINDSLDLLSNGDFPELIESSKKNDEFSNIYQSVNKLVKNLKNVEFFAKEVGDGKFETNMTVFNDDSSLGKSLEGMRNSLKIVSDNDKKRNWATKGLAEFSNILRQSEKNIKELSYEIISNVVKYLDINQGSIFILNKENENIKDSTLTLEACYAYNRRKYKNKEIKVGEGLVGQCVLEEETIYMTDVPKDYIKITSGLGESTPSSILIVPLKVNEEIYGVIEIASFKTFEDYEIKFMEDLGENIASTISGVKINEKTTKLLEESQIQSEQMKSQEEEMRQNMEELQATQEEMERKNREIEKIREEEKKRSDEEVNRLNEVMSDYMNNFYKEKTQLENKIKKLEKELQEKNK